MMSLHAADRTHELRPALVAALAVLLAALVPAQPSGAAEDLVRRLAGDDRYETAAAVALDTHEAVDTVVLARSQPVADGQEPDFADAVAGATLAGALDAAVLLTAGDHVPEPTMDALSQLAPDEVRLLGGSEAIDPAIAETLTEAGYAVERHSGASRIETAAAIVAAADTGADTAIVATGYAFPDALAAGSLAYGAGYPLLLTAADELPQATADPLTESGVRRVLVPGGPGAVSERVVAELETIVDEVVRLYDPERFGTDRSATAVAIADHAIETLGWELAELGVTSPTAPVDAMAAAQRAGGRDAVLLLVDGPATTDGDSTDAAASEGVYAAASDSDETWRYAREVLQTTQSLSINLFGGSTVVSEQVEQDIDAMVDEVMAGCSPDIFGLSVDASAHREAEATHTVDVTVNPKPDCPDGVAQVTVHVRDGDDDGGADPATGALDTQRVDLDAGGRAEVSWQEAGAQHTVVVGADIDGSGEIDWTGADAEVAEATSVTVERIADGVANDTTAAAYPSLADAEYGPDDELRVFGTIEGGTVDEDGVTLTGDEGAAITTAVRADGADTMLAIVADDVTVRDLTLDGEEEPGGADLLRGVHVAGDGVTVEGVLVRALGWAVEDGPTEAIGIHAPGVDRLTVRDTTLDGLGFTTVGLRGVGVQLGGDAAGVGDAELTGLVLAGLSASRWEDDPAAQTDPVTAGLGVRVGAVAEDATVTIDGPDVSGLSDSAVGVDLSGLGAGDGAVDLRVAAADVSEDLGAIAWRAPASSGLDEIGPAPHWVAERSTGEVGYFASQAHADAVADDAVRADGPADYSWPVGG